MGENSRVLNGWTIVFDLDGTLVETAPDLCAALNHILKGADMQPILLEQVRGIIGDGAKALIRRAHSIHGLDLASDKEEQYFQELLVYYQNNIADTSYPFKHIVPTLDQLSAHGAKLAVCTNKTQILADSLLDALDLSKYFSSIIGRDTVDKPKPNPSHILETITAAGGRPAQAIMIGDSNTDAKAAFAAEIPFILLEYGYHGNKLDGIKADFRLPDAADLFNTIELIAQPGF